MLDVRCSRITRPHKTVEVPHTLLVTTITLLILAFIRDLLSKIHFIAIIETKYCKHNIPVLLLNLSFIRRA